MKPRRPVKILILVFSVVLIMFLGGLLAAPYLIDLGLERWLTSQGPEIGKVENIDFNPFTGRLSMDNLVVETKSGRTLSITHASLAFSWKQLFSKQLYLKELVVEDTYMLVDRLEESGLRIGGLILGELAGTEEKSGEPGWEVGIGLFEMQNGRIEYDTPELAATYIIDHYTLKGLETWNKQKPVLMSYLGRINESRMQVNLEVVLLDVVKSWKGRIVLENGSLELLSKVRGLQEYGPQGSLDIDLNLDARMHEDSSIVFAAEGTAALRQLQLHYEKYGLQQAQIVWQGSITGVKPAVQGLELTADGRLRGTGLQVDDNATARQLLLGAFNWHGKAGFSRQEHSFTVTMESDFDGENVHAKDGQNEIGWLGLEKFSIAGLQIDGLDEIRLARLVLQNLRLLEKEAAADIGAAPPLLQTAAAEFDSISLKSGEHIFINSISLTDLQADFVRAEDGNWQLIPPQPAEPAIDPGQVAPQVSDRPGKAAPINFQLGKLQVGGDNVIRFADESLPRPFRTTFHMSELALADINTADPAALSTFKVKGQVGEYSTLEFDGTLEPGTESISLDLQGTVSALDMPPFSSYTGPAIGYNVTSGQLDADIEVHIDKGMMDNRFDLRMRNLEVAQVDPDRLAAVDNQMDVPLGSALAMLRNKKDEINLDLAMQGNIASPEFGIRDAINQALAKAMKFATLSYLKYTLQPFGTYIALAEVVGKAGKEMSKVGLDPVLFPAGEILLDETANQYLGKIKELLDNRPKLRLELCGTAVEKDRVVLHDRRLAASKTEAAKDGGKQETAAQEPAIPDEVLLDFARERAKLVKDSLVKQHSINHERIYLCLPKIDSTPANEPSVGLFLD